MLSREQFLSIAAQLKVANRGLFEKDYALSCLLDSFIEVEPLSTKFVFKGGTALRKVYFSDWRYSELQLGGQYLHSLPEAQRLMFWCIL